MTNYELDKCIKEYMNGNEQKFEDIYNETRKIVYLSICSIITSEDEIEDIMQDTYMKAIKNLESYKFGTNFKAWISSIARNLSINLYNKRKRELLVDDTYEFESSDDNSLIKKALNLLKDDSSLREVFIYHIIFNLSFREISRIMDLPKSTVHDTYKKAITIIKNNLEDLWILKNLKRTFKKKK